MCDPSSKKTIVPPTLSKHRNLAKVYKPSFSVDDGSPLGFRFLGEWCRILVADWSCRIPLCSFADQFSQPISRIGFTLPIAFFGLEMEIEKWTPTFRPGREWPWFQTIWKLPCERLRLHKRKVPIQMEVLFLKTAPTIAVIVNIPTETTVTSVHQQWTFSLHISFVIAMNGGNQLWWQPLWGFTCCLVVDMFIRWPITHQPTDWSSTLIISLKFLLFRSTRNWNKRIPSSMQTSGYSNNLEGRHRNYCLEDGFSNHTTIVCCVFILRSRRNSFGGFICCSDSKR